MGQGARLAALAAVVALAGCMNGGLFGGSKGNTAHAPREAMLEQGSFVVAGPRGFCVDDGSTREDTAGAFVLLGSCSAISGNPHDAKPRQPAVLTASVAPGAGKLGEEDLDRMATFFATDKGRATLSRAGSGGPVTLIEMSRAPGLVLVHAADTEAAPGMAADYWRAVFAVSDRLVTVTVSGFVRSPLDVKTGQRLASDFVRAISKANGQRTPLIALAPTPLAAPEATPAAETADTPDDSAASSSAAPQSGAPAEGGLLGLLHRVF